MTRLTSNGYIGFVTAGRLNGIGGSGIDYWTGYIAGKHAIKSHWAMFVTMKYQATVKGSVAAMSKICDRQYGQASMYSVKMIDGIGCCPSCNQPTQCHGATIEYRALFWVLTGDNGVSSKAIAKHMLNIAIEGMFGFQPPSDRDDRSRCIKLLELIPEWLPRLDELKRYDVKKQEGIVITNSGIGAYDNSWSKQIPLIAKEGDFYAKS